MADLTPTELAVIDGLVEFNAFHKEYSLADVARACNVAKSTVVKTLKKLGYDGFQDFSASYKVRASTHHDSIFPRRIVLGSFSDATRIISNSLRYGIGRKNLVSPIGSILSRPIAGYISRKMELFELFAPVSYDYIMFETREMEPGTLFMFLQSSTFNPERDPGQNEYITHNIDMAAGHGFRTLIFTDLDYLSSKQGIDVVRIATDPDSQPDLFAAKVLTVFESSLARFSSSLSEDPSNVQ